MKTFVYIDGFNLYYGACKKGGLGHRWLNPLKLCQSLLQSHHQIEKIWYFSAEVKSRPDDPTKLQRQRLYFRALRTLPCLEIELGSFLESKKTMLLADSHASPRMVEVIKTEEKGSDVNLATRMLVDAFDNAYECAIIISNDSDLVGPVKLVRSRFGKVVGILNPQKRPSAVLKKESDFFKRIRLGVVSASQFDSALKDKQGEFRKPHGW